MMNESWLLTVSVQTDWQVLANGAATCRVVNCFTFLGAYIPCEAKKLHHFIFAMALSELC